MARREAAPVRAASQVWCGEAEDEVDDDGAEKGGAEDSLESKVSQIVL